MWIIWYQDLPDSMPCCVLTCVYLISGFARLHTFAVYWHVYIWFQDLPDSVPLLCIDMCMISGFARLHAFALYWHVYDFRICQTPCLCCVLTCVYLISGFAKLHAFALYWHVYDFRICQTPCLCFVLTCVWFQDLPDSMPLLCIDMCMISGFARLHAFALYWHVYDFRICQTPCLCCVLTCVWFQDLPNSMPLLCIDMCMISGFARLHAFAVYWHVYIWFQDLPDSMPLLCIDMCMISGFARLHAFAVYWHVYDFRICQTPCLCFVLTCVWFQDLPDSMPLLCIDMCIFDFRICQTPCLCCVLTCVWFQDLPDSMPSLLCIDMCIFDFRICQTPCLCCVLTCVYLISGFARLYAFAVYWHVYIWFQDLPDSMPLLCIDMCKIDFRICQTPCLCWRQILLHKDHQWISCKYSILIKSLYYVYLYDFTFYMICTIASRR